MSKTREELNISREDWKRLYEIWRGMCRRCTDPTQKDYRHYAIEKRITVCDEWLNDFSVFAEWAMKHGYGPDKTLDRTNNHLGYRPDRCRWISRKAQALNRSTNTRLTIEGKTRTISQWSELSGTPDYTICKRLKAGWTVQDAVFKKKK